MNLIILTNSPFPNGMAGTNRMLSYSKGIVEQGSSVQVICLKPTEKEENTIRNPEIKGIIDGIEYEYSTGTTIWPNSGKKRFLKQTGQ